MRMGEMATRIACIALALLFSLPADAQTGTSGLSFLKIGLTGREIAMGDAGTASASLASAAYYNPAGLLSREARSEILFTHRAWIEGTAFDHLAASISLGSSDALGVSVTSIAVPEVEIRLRPGEPDGTFTARNFAGTVSFAHGFSEDLSAGLSAKILYEKILVDDATGLGVDLGVRYATGIDHLTLGVALANIGAMSSLRSEASPLPLLVRAGGALDVDVADGDLGGMIVADVVKVFKEADPLLDLGGELFWNKLVGIRGGYQFGSAGRGLTAGLGVRYGSLRFDYAFSRLAAGLGDGHSFTLLLSY
jgi:hypothetical protein